jgi:hypothetical protein
LYIAGLTHAELSSPAFWESEALNIAKVLVTRDINSSVVSALATWITGAITAGVAEDSIPVAGQVMQAISVAIGEINILQTTIELGVTPWTYVDDLVFTHDLAVMILKDSGDPNADPPDPGDDTFPKAATGYTVTAMFDDGTPHVQRFPLSAPVPSTLPPVKFSNVPFGGNVNVSVAFVQEASLPGLPDIMLGKGTTGLVPNTSDCLQLEIEEVAFPISSNTVYQHRQKTTLDAGGHHVWAAAPAPTVNASNSPCGLAGTACGFRGISVRQGTGSVRGYVGYAWQAQNSDPSRRSPVRCRRARPGAF